MIYALENDLIDAALVSGLEGDGSTWKAEPRVVTTRDGVLATAGSRYTYSPNLMAYGQAIDAGHERLAVVGMGCMASTPAVMQARKAGKVARRLGLTIEDQIREAVRIVSEIYGISEAEAGSQMGVKPQG